MSRDVRSYWREIRSIEATLQEFVWLTDENGSAVHVPARIGARLLCEKSHRMSTPGEIESQRVKERAVARKTQHDELYRNGIAIVTCYSEKTPWTGSKENAH